MKNKKFIIITSAIVALLVIVGIVLWYVNIQMPYNNAVKDYSAAVKIIDEKNAELDKAIEKVQTLIDSGEKTLDDTIVDKAIEYKLGARGLRSIVETIMVDAMFDIPSSGIKKFIVDKKYVEEQLEKAHFEKN